MIGYYEITRMGPLSCIIERTSRRTRLRTELELLHMVHRAIEAQAGLDTEWGLRIWHEAIRASKSEDWVSGYTLIQCRDQSVMIRRRVDILA